jgi:hypothetical protein
VTSRRRLLATLGTGGAIAVAKTLPESWTKPLIDSVMLPAHGETSPTIPLVSLSSTPASAPEDGGTFTFELSLSAATTNTVTVVVAYTGTATAGTDYSGNTTSHSISPGELSTSWTLTGIADASAEGNESIIADIQSVTNATENGTQTETLTLEEIVFAVGDTGPGGGIVFFIENGGTTGLEAMTTDQTGTLTYGSKMEHNSASTTDGAANTAAILAAEPSAPAAKACNDLTSGGKSDWYLPAEDQLVTLISEWTTVGLLEHTYYWSSTQHATNYDYARRRQISGEANTQKPTGSKVRAIRSF